MFGQQPRLLVDFIFPTVGSNEAPTRKASARNVDVYIASVRDQLRSALWEAQAQSTAEAHQFETWWPGTSEGRYLEGKRKIKDRWDEETWEVS